MAPSLPDFAASQPRLHALHVVDARDGVESILAARAALDIPGHHDVILIGNTRDERFAGLLGVVTTDRVSPAGGPALLLRLRRLAADRLAAPAARASTPVLIAHGPVAATIARSAVPRRIPMLAVLARGARGPDQRLALALEDDVALTFDADIARAWREFGLHDVRVLPLPLPLSDPAGRRILRARLGIEDDVLVLTTLADPPAAGDARRLSSFTGWLYTMDRRAVGITPRGAGDFRRAVRFSRVHGRRWGMLEVDLPLPLLLPACDLALVDASTPTAVGPMMVRAAQAAGVASVVPQAPWLRRLHADDEARRLLFAPNATALTMIHRLGHISATAESLAAARAAARRCGEAADPHHFARDLHHLIAERLNLPSHDESDEPRFIPAAAAAGAE